MCELYDDAGLKWRRREEFCGSDAGGRGLDFAGELTCLLAYLRKDLAVFVYSSMYIFMLYNVHVAGEFSAYIHHICQAFQKGSRV